MLWVYNWLGSFLWESLFGLEWSSFWSSIFCMYLFISVASLSCLRWIFKPKSVHVIKGLSSLQSFQVFALSPSRCMLSWEYFSRICNCFYVVYRFGFFVMIFPFPYFASKSSCLSCTRLRIWLRQFSFYLFVKFFSLFWNVLFCLYCLVLYRYLFSLPYFARIF